MAPKIALFPACGGLAAGILKQLLHLVPASELLLVARKPEKLEHLSCEGATVRYADYDVPASLGQVFEGASVLMLVSYASIEIEYRANVSYILTYLAPPPGILMRKVNSCIDKHRRINKLSRVLCTVACGRYSTAHWHLTGN